MKIFCILLTVIIMSHSANAMGSGPISTANDTLAPLTGNFTDDYGIRYQVSDTLWFQLPRARYHILKWDKEGQFIIAKNDAGNPTEPGMYTRIDYVFLEKMPPWNWAFCLTVYNAISQEAALKAAGADRSNPRKGCNGYPFSRMKKSESNGSISK